jgi:hypothetical protein
MNKDEAKRILALYRPGTGDREDPVFKAAAELAKSDAVPGQSQEQPDPELARWFKEHSASYLSIRTKFLQIPVPADLKDRILTAMPQPAPSRIIPFRPVALLRAAAVLALCLGLIVLVWPSRVRQDDFNAYRLRMVQTALSAYGMPIHSHELQPLQAFLAAHKAPADYVVPAGARQAQPIGCAIVRWQGAPVSMLCFHTGKTPAEAGKPDLWLFVADQSVMRDAPAPGAPLLSQGMQLTTASWTQDGKTYVLATSGDEAFLRQYL